MTTPNLARYSRLSRWMALSGVSRTASTSFRCSLMVTSAARDMRSAPSPQRIAATVFMLQGSTIMASCWKEPLEMAAAWSLTEYTRVASLRI